MNAVELTDGRILCDKVFTTKIEETDGHLIALVSTDSIDSDDDIIHQGENDEGKGWNLERFNKHPVMLWSHDIFVPSLGGGKAWVGQTDLGKGLHFSPQFDQADEFARTIEGKIKRGVITETSVGFSSNNYARRRESDSMFGGYEFFDSELVEISWVNRGANPDVDSMVKNMIKRDPSILGKIKDFNDPILKELKEDFIDRLTEMEIRLRTMENAFMAKDKEAIDEMAKTCLENFGRLTK